MWTCNESAVPGNQLRFGQARANITMKYSALLLIIIVVCLTQSYGKVTDSDDGELETQLLVSVEQGHMRGSWMKSSTGRQFAAFRSIPYAQPPVGELRFKDPVAAAPWDGVLDASREAPYCIQFDAFATRTIVGQEDCLKLNVYTHDVNTEELKPVMVYIHGGAFNVGSGNGETDMLGPKLFLDKDIILVTINYRLGVLGFLSTEDAEAPGNYGLLDQSLALKWVRENIRSFGGDSNSITIFGESAGGASVEYQVLSPLSHGLFHRAISQSGSSMCYWALQEEVGEYTKSLASLLDCPTGSSSEILQCLRTKSAKEIINMRRKFEVLESLEIFPVIFGPRIDVERENPFLPAHPRNLIANGRFNSVPYITGVNKNEGSTIVATLLSKEGKTMKVLEKDPMVILPFLLGFKSDKYTEENTKKVMDLFDKEKPFDQQLTTLEQVMSDSLMFKCTDESSRLFQKFNENPTYFYHYAYRASISLTMMYGLPPTIDLGVSHADELLLMFANDILRGPVTNDDKQISQLFIDLWTSFAIHGSPQSDLAPKWLPMDKDERRYLNIDVNNVVLTSEKLPYEDRLPFWNQMLDREQNESKKEEL